MSIMTVPDDDGEEERAFLGVITNQFGEEKVELVIPEDLKSGIRFVGDMACASSTSDSKRFLFWTPVGFQDRFLWCQLTQAVARTSSHPDFISNFRIALSSNRLRRRK